MRVVYFCSKNVSHTQLTGYVCCLDGAYVTDTLDTKSITATHGPFTDTRYDIFLSGSFLRTT